MANAGTHHDAAESVHWGTPGKIITPVKSFFGGKIDLDPCSNDGSIVQAVVEYKLPHIDGLKAPWAVNGPRTSTYVNPPFGRFYIRDDLQVIYSAKEWTRGRKLWKSYCDGNHLHLDEAATLACGAISDAEAARFTAYSIKDWVLRCKRAAYEEECEVISLLPAATDTGHWQDIIFPFAHSVCFIKGRLQFLGNVKGPAPMATALAYFGPNPALFGEHFRSLGTIRHRDTGVRY